MRDALAADGRIRSSGSPEGVAVAPSSMASPLEGR
jgi:hypothetical protein